MLNPETEITHLRDSIYIVNKQNFFLNYKTIDFLKQIAIQSPRHMCRLCLHSSEKNLLNEMLLVYTNQFRESAQKRKSGFDKKIVVEGEAIYSYYDDNGNLINSQKLSKNHNFYASSDETLYHQLEVISEFFIFFEFASGPFNLSNKQILLF
jgi:cupin fold WbuC family metalloprotein